ncbi:MAG: hypothetical protein HFE77_07245 [Clostridiales bacterium]|nr:hypothetical protein [Clostridiales bacterium]
MTMKKDNILFFTIKFCILHIVNLLAFAAAILADTLLGFIIPVPFVETALVCAIAFVVFIGYTFASTAKMKKSPLPPSFFVLKESAAYMIFMIVPTVCSLVFGIDTITSQPVLRFYLPNLLGAHLLQSPIFGFILQTVIFCLVVTLAHNKNRKYWQAKEAEEERHRQEDEAYAEQLKAEQAAEE